MLLMKTYQSIQASEQNTTSWVTYDNRSLFFTVLEAGNLKSGCQYGQSRALFWVSEFSPYPHMAEQAGELSWASFTRALIPLMRALPS